MKLKTQIFHILLFKPIHLDISLQIIFYFKSDNQIEYKIKKIIDKNTQNCYFVKEKSYLNSNNIWKLKKNL